MTTNRVILNTNAALLFETLQTEANLVKKKLFKLGVTIKWVYG